MPRSILVSVALFAALDVQSPARAVNYFWNNSNDGGFGTASNWGPVGGGPGDADDTVNFELGTSTEERYTVIGVSGQNDRLLVHHDSLTLVLSDDYSLLSFGINPPSMVVGVANGEVGDVIIAGSPLGGVSNVLDTERVIIAKSAGSTGVVRASNLDWVSEDIFVGNSGEGTLEVLGGSNISGRAGIIGNNLNSNGMATVSGTDSRWDNSGFSVGSHGDGTLIISNGGSVSSSAGIGVFSSGTGTATVTGVGSSWTSDNELYVGHGGTGTLTIQDGGSVENGRGYIGDSFGSTGSATVSGTGSNWTNSLDLFVGNFGDGTLVVSSGGDVIGDRGILGVGDDSSGDATITGAGSTWTNSDVFIVGAEGEGTFTVSAGGRVSNTDGYIGQGFDSPPGDRHGCRIHLDEYWLVRCRH